VDDLVVIMFSLSCMMSMWGYIIPKMKGCRDEGRAIRAKGLFIFSQTPQTCFFLEGMCGKEIFSMEGK
jgi:hypothetical protein